MVELVKEQAIAVADSTGTITFWHTRPSSGTMPLLAAFRLSPLSWLDPTGAAVKAAKKLADFISVIQERRKQREQDRIDKERLSLMKKYPDVFKADYSDFKKSQQEKRVATRKEFGSGPADAELDAKANAGRSSGAAGLKQALKVVQQGSSAEEE